jgi:hypothetical protein
VLVLELAAHLDGWFVVLSCGDGGKVSVMMSYLWQKNSLMQTDVVKKVKCKREGRDECAIAVALR